MTISPCFELIFGYLNLSFHLPACISSVKACESDGWRELEWSIRLAGCLGNSERGNRKKYRKRWNEKRGGREKNAIAVKVPGEFDDAKWKHNNRTESKKRKKERVSKMCLTAGACVGVMGDPAGPRRNLQVCALPFQHLAGVLQWRCHYCCFLTHTFTWAHKRCTGTQSINTQA